MTLRLGCIADDFTGATDLALQLRQGGYSVVQTIGVVDKADVPAADAIVVALKTRTIEPAEAVRQSVAAWHWLNALGMQQCYFKYCSTFDSTSRGNIGPVLDALLNLSGDELAVACPAFPVNGRSVYMGYLFVNNQLLSESSMQHHPLTPMTDPNLVRVLQEQSSLRVGAVMLPDIAAGVDRIKAALAQAVAAGNQLVVTDAVDNSNLDVTGRAVMDHALVSGGSALAASLVRARIASGDHSLVPPGAVALPAGHSVILAGSCSSTTLAQLAWACERLPSLKLDIDAIAENRLDVESVIQWASQRVAEGPIIIYASESPAQRSSRDIADSDALGDQIEQAFRHIAPRLLQCGVRRFVVAGGETSGSVVSSLGVNALHIGDEIDPGVPWTVSTGADPVALALKSGNFGGEDFLLRALQVDSQGESQESSPGVDHG